MAIFHYSRVSTDEQTTENQVLAAKAAGYTVDHFYADEDVSGSTQAESRIQYSAMLEKMVAGDILVISEVSRIGRNTIDVLKNIEYFEKLGVKVCVLQFGNLDLTSEIGTFVVTMAAAFSAMELQRLKARTRAGMARTKANGTKLGAPLKITPEQMSKIVKDKKAGVSLCKISEKYSIHRNTLRNNLTEWEDNLTGYKKEYLIREAQYEKNRQKLLGNA